MKPDDFQRIEKELHEQMNNERKQQNKVDLWYTNFETNTAGPVSLESQNTFTSEDTFYSFSENDQELPSFGSSCKMNDILPYKQGLVQKVSEAGIIPLGDCSSEDRRQSGMGQVYFEKCSFVGV